MTSPAALVSPRSPAPGRGRVLLLAAFASVAVFCNSLGNGFAFDDMGVVVDNPVVTGGHVAEAARSPWWVDPDGGGVLFRPLTLASFAMEWTLGGGSPLLFHALNVVLHLGMTLMVGLLLWRFADPWPALAGALLFAVHPVHVEAVANVVGRAELFSALPFLAACLLYLQGREWPVWGRAARLVGIGLLYLVGLAGKEMAVTLPAALALLELYPPSGSEPARGDGGTRPSYGRRLLSEAPLFVLLAVVLVAYLGARLLVLGSLRGEVGHPAFVGAPPAAPFLTGLTLWPEYLRLMVFPTDLSVDYDPAVIPLQPTVSTMVVLGGLTLLGLVLLAVLLHRRAPLISLGISWFGVTVLPVSHLILHPAVFLAERTLYLPSVGMAFVAAGVVGWSLGRSARAPLAVAGLGVVVLGLLAARTVARNPSWFSSQTVMEALDREHPESWRAHLSRGGGFERNGALAEAADEYELAERLLPNRFGTMLAAARVDERVGREGRSEELLRKVVALYPSQAGGYRAQAAFLLRQGRGREAHRVAVTGLQRTFWDGTLLGLLSESYVLAGDLPAAIRARRAALAVEPDSLAHRERLSQLTDALRHGVGQPPVHPPEDAEGSRRGLPDPPPRS